MIMRKYFQLNQWWVGDDDEYFEKYRVSPVTMITGDTHGHLWDKYATFCKNNIIVFHLNHVVYYKYIRCVLDCCWLKLIGSIKYFRWNYKIPESIK